MGFLKNMTIKSTAKRLLVEATEAVVIQIKS